MELESSKSLLTKLQIRQLKDDLPDDYSYITKSPQSNDDLIDDLDSIAEPLVPRVTLLAGTGSLPQEQILAMIPPRKIVDRHVFHFFNAFDLAPLILNRSKFLTEYESFWANRHAAPTMWIGLLFSILSMSAFQHQQQDITTVQSSTVDVGNELDNYRAITIGCLITGDYLRSRRYTIETLVLHFALEQQLNVDPDISNWILIGVIIRIALRNGMHRDPSHWPNIRPLQAELRRRTWIALYQMDLFTSTQVGLPRIIKDSQCDARPPSNLIDNDLSIDSDTIPPGRPLTDDTPLSHIIQRHGILKVTAEIYDATEAGLPSAPAIATLDAKLQKAVDDIPAYLKHRSLESSIADSPVTILQRTFIDILIHKAIYLLHRRSFMRGTNGERNARSNETCIDAALTILEHQQNLAEETQPGGIMFAIRWKVVSSLAHEFLQATMMLCLALSRYNDEKSRNEGFCPLYKREQVLQTLTRARLIWDQNSSRSIEAQRARKTITTVLQQSHIQEHEPMQSTPQYDSLEEMLAPSSTLESRDSSTSFNFAGGMALDPPSFMIDDGIGLFGGMLDVFPNENIDESWPGSLPDLG